MDSDNSKQAISSALSVLTALKGNIESIGGTMLEVANESVEIVKEQMSKYSIPTGGALGGSIRASPIDKNSARLDADGGHAA